MKRLFANVKKRQSTFSPFLLLIQRYIASTFCITVFNYEDVFLTVINISNMKKMAEWNKILEDI